MKALLVLAAATLVFGLAFLAMRQWGGLGDYGWEVQALVGLLMIGVPLSVAARCL